TVDGALPRLISGTCTSPRWSASIVAGELTSVITERLASPLRGRTCPSLPCGLAMADPRGMGSSAPGAIVTGAALVSGRSNAGLSGGHLNRKVQALPMRQALDFDKNWHALSPGSLTQQSTLPNSAGGSWVLSVEGGGLRQWGDRRRETGDGRQETRRQGDKV